MKLKDLTHYADYDIPILEFYNEDGELEYSICLDVCDFDDIDVVYGRYFEPYGVIKIKRNDESRFNGKGIQPPPSKL